jgi:hypothetical protein
MAKRDGKRVKVFIEDSSALLLLGQCGFWFQHDDEHHFCFREQCNVNGTDGAVKESFPFL